MGRADGGLVQAQVIVHSRIRQEISRQMLAHELVVGYVGVQGSDQVIAVAERVGDVWVALAPVGIGVAHPVHPVPAPSLPELWFGE